MIWDMSGTGPINWDLPMLRSVVTILRTYFPGGLKYLIPFGIPRVMTPFVNFAVQLLPEDSKKKVHIIQRDQIFDYIEPIKVPDFMSGLSLTSYKIIPEGVKGIKEMANEYKLTKYEINTILKYYEHELREV